MATKHEKYTKPKLREQIKEKIEASEKGGRPGQWSARKSQLLVQEYEREGGGYKQSADKKDEAAKSLDKWTEEDWQTKEGDARARDGKTTKRYLPKEAWDKLSDKEKKETDRKKQAGSKKGQQFVDNTAAAKKARREVTNEGTDERTKSELYDLAKKLDIPGRSKMSKGELSKALQKV